MISHRFPVYAAFCLAFVAATLSAQHDCFPYPPSMAGAVVNDDWDEPFEIDQYQIDVPADAGGGYVVASLSSPEPSQPGMRIIPPSGLGVVAQTAPTQPISASPQTIEVAFEVDASTTFMVEIFESTVAPQAAHPIPYTWSWNFVSKVDCYEPNDGDPNNWPEPVPDARNIPLNQIHEAFGLAGHLDFSISWADAHNYDWYKFTLAVPTSVWAATAQVPNDQGIRLRIFDDDGLVAITGSTPAAGQTVAIGPELLEVGTYYLEILPVDRGLSNVATSEGEAIPDHFVTPYQFIVGIGSVIPPCVDPRFIFCDDFETGDTSWWSLTIP